ncbi:MAG TPA: IS21-like element helper ATPase IstB [Thermotogota bacterium]|nr:IS21-like element helper ATPase IstB [Thermotogota bacterium]HQC38416.1 IS21-like element helper ATPase IstB [Thermotogota bacterium]HQN23042.1 IS21-like element helper ATPase IstB [Thermotogota bacterium]
MSYPIVHELLTELKLYGIEQTLDTKVEEWSHKNEDVLSLLQTLLQEEKHARMASKVKSRTRYAGFPFHKTLNDFDFSFQPSIDKALIQTLSSLKFLYNHENILFLGAPGVGKSHLAIGLGMRVAEEGKQPYFIPAITLVDKLKTAFKEYRFDTVMRFFRSVDLLIIDELGYLPLDLEGSKLLFELISSRYEKGSIILTSNRPFSEWDKVFSDHVIATAILDRILHHSHIVNIRGKSYRLKEKMKSGLWEGTPHKNSGETSHF